MVPAEFKGTGMVAERRDRLAPLEFHEEGQAADCLRN